MIYIIQICLNLFILAGLDPAMMGQYESAVVNYMPALKWLLVVMEHQRKLEAVETEVARLTANL